MSRDTHRLVLVARREETAAKLVPMFTTCGWEVLRAQPFREDNWSFTSEDVELLVIGLGAHPPYRLWIPAVLRAIPASLPTIVVGGRMTNARERIEALNAGAHECIPLPISTEELRARLNSLMSLLSSATKAGHGRSDTIRRQYLELWTNEKIAFHAGRPMSLSRIEFALLHCLVANTPPVTRETLLRDVFQRGFDPGSNVVEVQIHRLRRKLRACSPPLFIQTVRGQGYELAASDGL